MTTFKVVPRGTEGAISVEGTIAGILASGFLAAVGYLLGQVDILCLTEIKHTCYCYNCSVGLFVVCISDYHILSLAELYLEHSLYWLRITIAMLTLQ